MFTVTSDINNFLSIQNDYKSKGSKKGVSHVKETIKNHVFQSKTSRNFHFLIFPLCMYVLKDLQPMSLEFWMPYFQYVKKRLKQNDL